MTIKATRFSRAIIIKPDDVAVEGIAGELKVGLTSKQLHAYLDGALRTVVTTDQTQVISNKTLDASNVIAVTPAGNLEADELNAALQELQSDIDAINSDNSDDVEGPASAVDNSVTRFDGTTGKLIQSSLLTISDLGEVTGATQLNVDNLRLDGNSVTTTNSNGNLTIQPNGTGEVVVNSTKLKASGSVAFEFDLISSTGSNLNLSLSPKKNFRAVDPGLVSISTIDFAASSVTSGQEVLIQNVTGNSITINNLSGTPTNRQIQTGTGGNLIIEDQDTVSLVYNSVESQWVVRASTFKGPSSATANAIPRFSATDGQAIANSGVLIDSSNEVTGATKLTVDNLVLDGNTISQVGGTDITLQPEATERVLVDGSLQVNNHFGFAITVDSTTTGAAATFVPSTKTTRLTDLSLESISIISNSTVSGQEITLINDTGNSIYLIEGTGGVGEIKTGTGNDLEVKPNATISLVFEENLATWYVAGGAGGGGDLKFNITAGEDLVAGDYVYISKGGMIDVGRQEGYLYKVDPTNDNRIEGVGFVFADALSASLAVIRMAGIADITSPALTTGSMCFADPSTPGAITDTPPSTNGQWSIPVGVALNSSQILINPAASASATYITTTEFSASLSNNISSATSVSGMLVDPLAYRGFVIDYTIYRATSTTALAQVGQLRGVYNTFTNTYFLSDDYSGENAGVTFSILSSGQIQYTSTNMSGTGHTGTLKYNITKAFTV